MNVFVLCTGRSGSTTFAQACGHFTNFTAGHESRSSIIGPSRLDYPDNHIEADHRLTKQLGALEMRYGDNATYVHLLRDRETVARSMARLIDGPMSSVRAFASTVLGRPSLTPEELMPVCLDYVDTVTTNVNAYLVGKSRAFTIHLESPHASFADFAEAIGAEGDLDAAHRELDVQHNQKRDPSYARKKSQFAQIAMYLANRIP
ncbi:hypothetical protein [Devosia aurantiaca]|uniref:hypothetical protein n=1 Tax=Devosia aurantiaca TaxID=2714858 RepID=UPI001A98ADDC|nr:hypothetical protein [Devosia aurantiaca]